MNEAEALNRAIQQLTVHRDQSAENLYGRRYKDRTKHPDHEAIREILAEDDEAIALLSALRDRLVTR